MVEAGYDHLNKLENNEHIFLNSTAEDVEIKDIIKIEETVIYDGTNYLNNEIFRKIKLENGELSTNENCDENKNEQLDELSNSIYKDNDFPNQVLSDEHWNGNGEKVPTNNSRESPVDMKMMIEIGETTYLKYENCGIKIETNQDNCNEYKSERKVEENKDRICDDGDFSNQETVDGEQLNQNEFSNKLDKSEAIVKCIPGKRIQCQFCDTTTTTRATMKRHIEVVHFGLRNHKCEYCGYAAVLPSVLKYHINSVHHKIRNHKCQYCDYATSHSGVLKTHINAVHLKLNNHKCEHCDFTANSRALLKHHKDVVHNLIKNHKCEYCDYTAFSPSVIKYHINHVHQKIRNHKCEYCDYAASQLGGLKNHINAVHLQLKNHKCDHCDYATSRSKNLKKHMTVHHKM